MKQSLHREFRYLLPAWLFCVLPPLVPILFLHSANGRSGAVMLFSCGCAILSGYSFRRDVRARSDSSPAENPKPYIWRERILPLAVALLAASVIFSTLSLVANDPGDFATPMLSFMVIVPALGIVPYMVLTTRSFLAGIVFSIFLVGSIKTPIGAAIVRTFFPSHFQQAIDTDGSLVMPTPWLHPNMLVWFFYVVVALLSFLFFLLNARGFCRRNVCPP